MLAELYELFWKEHYWFIHNVTWADLEDSEGVTYPHPKDLLISLPLTLVLVIVRHVCERTIGLSLGRFLGIRDPHRIKPAPNSTLASFFQTQSRNPNEAQMSYLASQCDLSLRQVQRWFLRRRNQERPLLSKKFSESCWRFLFYFSSFAGGFFNFYKEEWLWNPSLVWNDYPKQSLPPYLYLWYILELSFYFSLLVSLSSDVKRKDFKEQVAHHLIASLLIFYSYTTNCLRIATVIILLLDSSDFLLEICKMLNYAQWKHSSNTIFIFFAMLFLFNRLYIFPTRVIYSIFYVSRNKYEGRFMLYVANVLLLGLQFINIFWSYLILKMSYHFVIIGTVKKDVRSDVEELDSNDESSERGELKNETLQSKTITDTKNLPRFRGAWKDSQTSRQLYCNQKA